MIEMRKYDFCMMYVKGKENVVADQLSRPGNVVTHRLLDPWIAGKEISITTLDQFELMNGILFYVKEATDANQIYTAVVPRQLVRKAL